MAARKAARRPTRTRSKTRRKAPKSRAVRRTRPARRGSASKAAKRTRTAPPTKRSRAKQALKKPKKKVAVVRPAAKARTKVKTRTKAAPTAKARVARPAAPPKPALPAAPARPRLPRPALDRARRILPEAERIEREVVDEGVFAAARSGGEELQHRLGQHTEASPALTAGDVDAKWDDAYAVGDEAPGGDNPTPDQDRVDDIGKALGVTYDDNEELQGSDKITERDRHRWELDPASSDDWPHEK